MSEQKNTVGEIISALKQQRDELNLKMHLANAELRDELEKLDDKYVQLKSDYEPLRTAVGDTANDVWESLKLVGTELKEGFARIRKAL